MKRGENGRFMRILISPLRAFRADDVVPELRK